MPRKNPLPERESQICERLLEFRKSVGLTRIAFAQKGGIDSSIITRCDHQLAPLKFGAFRSLATTFPINPHWLATGDSIPNLPEPVSPILLQCPGAAKSLFSAVYDQYLGKVFSSEQLVLARDFDLLRLCVCRISGRLEAKGKTFPCDFRERMAMDLKRIAGIIESIGKFEFEQSSKLGADFFNLTTSKGLTVDSLKGNTTTVKPEIEKLIARVKRKTLEPGMKAELARTLGVAPARISEWLSDKKKPGGAYTLKLLHWVEQQERQK